MTDSVYVNCYSSTYCYRLVVAISPIWGATWRQRIINLNYCSLNSYLLIYKCQMVIIHTSLGSMSRLDLIVIDSVSYSILIEVYSCLIVILIDLSCRVIKLGYILLTEPRTLFIY